jgi:hypothetical protein
MSEKDSESSFDSTDSLAKWGVLALIAIVAILVIGPAVRAKARPVAGESPLSQAAPIVPATPAPATIETPAPAAPKAEAPAPKPAPRVVAANTQPVPVAPLMPGSADIAACNQYAAAARTQPGEVVRDGVIGAAVGAGVGAASGAIADGGKGAGKGAGIGAVVGGVAGTAYSLNKRAQDDMRADTAYRSCMAQRGF